MKKNKIRELIKTRTNFKVIADSFIFNSDSSSKMTHDVSQRGVSLEKRTLKGDFVSQKKRKRQKQLKRIPFRDVSEDEKIWMNLTATRIQEIL